MNFDGFSSLMAHWIMALISSESRRVFEKKTIRFFGTIWYLRKLWNVDNSTCSSITKILPYSRELRLSLKCENFNIKDHVKFWGRMINTDAIALSHFKTFKKFWVDIQAFLARWLIKLFLEFLLQEFPGPFWNRYWMCQDMKNLSESKGFYLKGLMILWRRMFPIQLV